MSTDFASRFAFDSDAQEDALIRVVGVGGGGGNAVNNMISKGITGVEFIAVNTDAQALQANSAPHKIQVGRELTKGLGAGARPAVGAEAVGENQRDIEQVLEGCDMVFITAGMGGGTGTGAAPVVAATAKRLGVLTVAVVTTPFAVEGRKRMRTAKEGIAQLREAVDTLIIIPNERLLDVADADTPLVEAFAMADEVLYNAVRGISDLITVHGLINLDFADVRTTMVDGGTALMGSAVATGPERARESALDAISSPLLGGVSIRGARNVLVNITAGTGLGIREATQAMGVVQDEAGDEAEVIFGTVIDDNMGEDFRVTVIATGFDGASDERPAPQQEAEPTLDDARVRRTVKLDGPSVPNYKGEEHLRQLDVPAYERRTRLIGRPGASDADGAPSGDAAEPSPGDDEAEHPRAELRRVRAGGPGPSGRPERIRKDDTNVPAFLRKMMD
jgi:cell division protein FtsZ